MSIHLEITSLLHSTCLLFPSYSNFPKSKSIPGKVHNFNSVEVDTLSHYLRRFQCIHPVDNWSGRASRVEKGREGHASIDAQIEQGGWTHTLLFQIPTQKVVSVGFLIGVQICPNTSSQGVWKPRDRSPFAYVFFEFLISDSLINESVITKLTC